MKPLMKGTGMALTVCAHMAKRPGQILSTNHMADSLGYSSAHLAKVYQTLSRRGIIENHRGAHGGFSIGAKAASTLTALDVVEAMEGPVEASVDAEGIEKRVHEVVSEAIIRCLTDVKLTEL